jgi:hypothetical protein
MLANEEHKDYSLHLCCMWHLQKCLLPVATNLLLILRTGYVLNGLRNISKGKACGVFLLLFSLYFQVVIIFNKNAENTIIGNVFFHILRYINFLPIVTIDLEITKIDIP